MSDLSSTKDFFDDPKNEILPLINYAKGNAMLDFITLRYL
jgi:hypothetical protein